MHFQQMDDVEISPYDPSWPAKFLTEQKQLQEHLSHLPLLDIRHFGSTAIPDMPAKPIIDILITVPSIAKARATFPPLLDKRGYDYWRDNPKQDRLFFVKGMPPRGNQRTHHVHVCERPSEMWDGLAFCEYLRNHPDDAKAYATLKQQLSETHHDDREAYTKAKGAFVAAIMEKALR